MNRLFHHFCPECGGRARKVKPDPPQSGWLFALGDVPGWLFLIGAGGGTTYACSEPGRWLYVIVPAISMLLILGIASALRGTESLYECSECKRVSTLAGFERPGRRSNTRRRANAPMGEANEGQNVRVFRP